MAIDRQKSPYRRGIRYDLLPIPMVTEHCIAVDAGPVQLVVESRTLTNEIIKSAYDDVVDAGIPFDDFGATLHVCGTADGLEHLRFDCFEDEPHYHYIEQAEGANTVVRIDELAVGDPIDFSLACVEHHLPDMLRHCGVAGLADEVAAAPDKLDAAMAEVRELMRKARTFVARALGTNVAARWWNRHVPSSWWRVSSYRPTTWIAQPESPCRRKITSLIALASWSFQSVTRVLTTRWRCGRLGFHLE